MSPEFKLAFEILMKNESTRYVNDPDDSGGATKFGICNKRDSESSYESFLGRPVSDEEIENLTINEAYYFYWWAFWMPLSCPKLTNSHMAICIFDTAVLYGLLTTGKFAQMTVQKITGQELKIDGIIGDKSVTALNEVKGDDFIKTFRSIVLARIDQVIETYPTKEKFRRGWTLRANRLLVLLNKPIV